MATRRWVLVALLVAVVAAGWLLERIDWTFEEVARGATAEARQNPYLAARLFLERLGGEVHRLEGAQEPPASFATVLLAAPQAALPPQRARAWWRFMEEGGHLVVDLSATAEGPLLRLLQERLGFSVSATGERGLAGIPAALRSPPERFCPESADALTPLELEEGGEIVVAIAPLRQIEFDEATAPDAYSGDAGQVLLAQYDVGDGMVTLFAETGLWRNGRIACADNAYLLWWLTGGDPLYIVHHLEHPSLPALIWRRAPEAVLALLLWLGLWLWYRGQRFGPRRVEPGRAARRSLREYLHASALFGWRHGHLEALLAPSRRAVEEAMARRHPGFERLDFDRRCRILARHAAMDEHRVRQAMAEIPADGRALTRLARLLQQLRRSV